MTRGPCHSNVVCPTGAAGAQTGTINVGHVYDSRGPGHGRNNMVYVHPHPCMHRVHVPTEQIRPSTSEESTTVKSPLPARPGGGGPMMPNVVEGRPDA